MQSTKKRFHRKFIPPSWRAQVSCIHCQSTFYLLLLPLHVACLLLVRCKLQLSSYQSNQSHHLSDQILSSHSLCNIRQVFSLYQKPSYVDNTILVLVLHFMWILIRFLIKLCIYFKNGYHYRNILQYRKLIFDSRGYQVYDK